MMNPMYVFEDSFEVHNPVCPIEIKVMKKEGDNKTYNQVNNTVVGYLVVDEGYPCLL